MYLKATNLKKTYGDRTIFEIEKLELREGSKIGLVGANGAGKSTLLAVLAGVCEPDEGRVDFPGRGTVALIPQEPELAAYAETNPATHGRRGFARPALTARPSGGELTRAAISDALAMRPDLLLADEPTTNLDIEGLERLQAELTAFRGALVLISHDRALLDAVCGTIWELDGGNLRTFPGNYSAWAEQRERERAAEAGEYEAYRRERKRLEAAARQMAERARHATKKPRGMSASEARLISNKNKGEYAQQGLYAKSKLLERRAERLDEKRRPDDLPDVRMALGHAGRLRAPVAVRVSGLSVSFGARTLLRDVSFDVVSNRRTVLLGTNGSGKTTLLEWIVRADDDRAVRRAPGLSVGYFGQGHDEIDPARTALENARAVSDLPEHEVRTILARLGIAGDDVHKLCRVMSGGERAKVSFARLFASNLNMLVMDEPTNHIDLYTAEALDGLLRAWSGTLLLVTHDRRLAEHVADRLLFIEDGAVRTFEGTWEEHAASRGKNSAAPGDSMLEMRMAELSARIASEHDAAKKEKLEKEWADLLYNRPEYARTNRDKM